MPLTDFFLLRPLPARRSRNTEGGRVAGREARGVRAAAPGSDGGVHDGPFLTRCAAISEQRLSLWTAQGYVREDRAICVLHVTGASLHKGRSVGLLTEKNCQHSFNACAIMRQTRCQPCLARTAAHRPLSLRPLGPLARGLPSVWGLGLGLWGRQRARGWRTLTSQTCSIRQPWTSSSGCVLLYCVLSHGWVTLCTLACTRVLLKGSALCTTE